MVYFRRNTPAKVENPEKLLTKRSLEMLNMVKQVGGMISYADLALKMNTTSREVEDECFLLTRAGMLVYNTDGYGDEFLSTKEHDLSDTRRKRGLLDANDNSKHLSVLHSPERGMADDKQDS